MGIFVPYLNYCWKLCIYETKEIVVSHFHLYRIMSHSCSDGS